MVARQQGGEVVGRCGGGGGVGVVVRGVVRGIPFLYTSGSTPCNGGV
jgi:hypothetical protein